MRRFVFITLALVVLATIAFFGWREFYIPGINFVTDSNIFVNENYLVVRRLYAADVDHVEYERLLDEIIILDPDAFTEEERFQAAIAAGRPVFHPAFNFHVHNDVRDGQQEILVDVFINIGVAENQIERRFRMGATGIEAIVQGDLEIERIDILPHPESDYRMLTKIYNSTQAAIDVTGAASFRVALTGAGMMTLNFVYNIDVETPLVLTVLEEQLLQVHMVVEINEAGFLVPTGFITEPYFELEQLLEEGEA
jgi:hypothetical protein